MTSGYGVSNEAGPLLQRRAELFWSNCSYRLWGSDINTDYNLYEAGIGFAARLNKGDFLGREALLDGDHVLGYITCANYGGTVGKSISVYPSTLCFNPVLPFQP